MAQLSTVSDYLIEARRLLQDEIRPYRYPDADLVDALNLGLMEARRIRPDLFIGRMNAVPAYSTTALTAPVVFDLQYRSALLYYVVGHAELRDAESSQDARAGVMKNKFVAQLLTLQS